ncbi:MAG: hypothetical protein ABSA13_13300 [Beijerinckiaceae bacterium]|jgi:hypothetical protein
MNIYRLDPIDPGHPAWGSSNEKDVVWAAAPTPEDARKLVALKTRIDIQSTAGDESPWLNKAVTSCVSEPTMTHVDAGTVVRVDGSLVGR